MYKRQGQDAALQEVCSDALELFRLLTLYLKPVLPKLAAEIEQFLNIAPLTWASVGASLAENHAINAYEHLITRIDPKAIEAMTEANKENLTATPAPQPCLLYTSFQKMQGHTVHYVCADDTHGTPIMPVSYTHLA